METLILTPNCVFDASLLSGLMFGENGKIFAAIKGSPNCEIIPFEEDKLWQFIRDGKLNASECGCLRCNALAASNSDISEDNTNLPSLLFFVRDAKNNIKFCEANAFYAAAASGENTAGVNALTLGNGGVYRSAFLLNFGLYVGDAIENPAQNA